MGRREMVERLLKFNYHQLLYPRRFIYVSTFCLLLPIHQNHRNQNSHDNHHDDNDDAEAHDNSHNIHTANDERYCVTFINLLIDWSLFRFSFESHSLPTATTTTTELTTEVTSTEPFEYITFNPEFNEIGGDSYVNRPHLNVAYSTSRATECARYYVWMIVLVPLMKVLLIFRW